MRYISILIIIFVIFSSLACGGRKVTRLESEYNIDLSGRFNDTDSKLISETIIKQCLENSWYSEYSSKHDRKPVVIVGNIRNKTMEHINVQTFTKDLEKALINSGKVKLVASSDERKEVRGERNDMQQWASIETKKTLINETAADFMLKGTVNSIIDEQKREKIVYYQADMSLINLEHNSIIWAGQKKIKKYIKRALYRF